MINKSDKQMIKRVIGNRYSLVIQNELTNCKEFNKYGVPYSTGHITNVMNGEKHEIIEAAIYRVFENQLEIQTQREHLIYRNAAVKNEEL